MRGPTACGLPTCSPTAGAERQAPHFEQKPVHREEASAQRPPCLRGPAPRARCGWGFNGAPPLPDTALPPSLPRPSPTPRQGAESTRLTKQPSGRSEFRSPRPWKGAGAGARFHGHRLRRCCFVDVRSPEAPGWAGRAGAAHRCPAWSSQYCLCT